MNMMVPARRRRTFLNDPFDAFFCAPPAPCKPRPSLMRTDIKEMADSFELTIDLPGFQREEITAELKDGYLKVSAKTNSESEKSIEDGTYVRKERFCGACSRTFYVGEEINEDEVRAKFDNGTLKIAIPKQQQEEQPETSKTISIS